MEKIEQPDIQLQELIDSVLSEEPTEYMFRGKKHKIGWVKKGIIRKFSHVCAKEKDLGKRNAKLCALIIINNIWKIRLYYWILWRYYYYIVDLDDVEILRVLDIAKKKIQSNASLLVTILATAMTDLMMTMTKKEAQVTRQEQVGEGHSA